MVSLRSLSVVLVAAAVAVGCGAGAGGADAASSSSDQTEAFSRDFGSHPAILEIDNADQLYALSDVHGEYDEFVKLLAASQLVDAADPAPTKVKWSGGAAILLVVGDLIDKGPKSLDVIDLVRSLEAQAAHAGGRVIALMGNHEAEFLADPRNSKATSTGQDQDGIDEELKASGVDPKSLASASDDQGRGRWMASLPLGVRVKKWFFSHAGNTQRLSIADLRKKLESSLTKNGYDDKDITGNDSILESQQWYGNPSDDNAGQKEVDALGNVNHIVFGHDPGAFGESGHIRQTKNGLLVKLDVAMGLHEGHSPNPGYLLHVSTKGKDSAEVIDDQGNAKPLD